LHADQRLEDVGSQIGHDLRVQVLALVLLGAVLGFNTGRAQLVRALDLGTHVLIDPDSSARARVNDTVKLPIFWVAGRARRACHGGRVCGAHHLAAHGRDLFV